MAAIALKTTDEVSETQHIDSENKDNLVESDRKKTESFTSVTTIEITELDDSNGIDDTVILRKDPKTKRHLINKTAYAKLHRTLSPGRTSSTIDNLKEKYEGKKPDLVDVKSGEQENFKTEGTIETGDSQHIYTTKRTSSVRLDEETLQSLKSKYSPGSFGYPRTQKNSKLPLPKPRGTVKSQIILPSNKQADKSRLRYSLDIGKKRKPKDENSNEVFRKNSSSSGEFITIITRSESEGSVDKFEKELDLFTMDGKPRDKKKTSGFKKLFSSKIFGKDKKKKEDEKNKVQHNESAVHPDSYRNDPDSFSRNSNYRHTTDGSSHRKPQEIKMVRTGSERFSQPKKVYITKDMEEKYAQQHINQFNHIKQTFEHTDSSNHPPQGYVRMDKPIVRNNPGPTNYMNLPSVKKFIDTSSSASTLDSDKSNVHRTTNEDRDRSNELRSRNDLSSTTTSIKFKTNKEGSRDTPPRAQETRQGVRLVNPKALIPINTERSLPNPFQNIDNSIDRRHSFDKDNAENIRSSEPHFEETYGTVFDSVEYDNKNTRHLLSKSSELRTIQKPPRSPSLESSKLKLPTKREIIPLSPRMKSPIPHDNVSAEKIIATELLKPTKSPPVLRKNIPRLSSPSHQNLEINIDYPDNVSIKENEKSFENVSSKPPISKIPFRKSFDNSPKQRISHASPSFDHDRINRSSPSRNMDPPPNYKGDQFFGVLENKDRVTSTNAVVHAPSPRGRTPTPNNILHNRPLSPLRPQSVRSSTPVDVSNSPTAKFSPQKEDMRRSVEAYYWKELKKLKEQENYDLYLYQMRMIPYGYAEDPITIRRSRSLSPTAQRNTRRSLSLPRESRPSNTPKEYIENPYGRMQPHSIPEGRAVVNQQQSPRSVIYGQVRDYESNFRRNIPERRTIDVIPKSSKPIFKRGSLTTPVEEYPEDFQNKKVSFSSSRADVQNLNSWPTKNGFTQSPPQRRIVDISRRSTIEDDVFLPPTPHTQYGVQEVYGYTNKPNVLYEYRRASYDPYQKSTKQNQEPVYGPNTDTRYGRPHENIVNNYGEAIDSNSQNIILRPNSIQIQDPLYGQRQLVTRKMSYDNANLTQRQNNEEPQYVNRQQTQREPRYGFKREIIVTDEIFGQFGGYIPQGTNEDRYLQSRQIPNAVYSSKQSIAEPIYGRSGSKQISVRDKVCDMYGQIHDRDSPNLTYPNYVKRSGVILGELQRSPGSPQVIRQSYGHLPNNEQFVRNSRLTASANDMYRRYQSTDPRYRSDVVYTAAAAGTRLPYQDSGAPTRPLPPVPVERKIPFHNNLRRSGTESARDSSDMQNIMDDGAKNKTRGFFGK